MARRGVGADLDHRIRTMTAPTLRRTKPAVSQPSNDETLIERILRAALEVFAEHGFAAAHIDEIARRAGTSRAALYHQFPSKSALFREVVRGGTVGILRARPERPDAATAQAELRALAAWYWECVRTEESAALHRLVLEERLRFPDLARLHAREVVARVADAMEAIIARGVARGEFSAVDSRTAANAVITMLLGQAVWCANAAQLGLRPYGDCATTLDRTLNVLLHGILLPESGRDAAPA
jgi:AcrR family transcriptional regulator